MLEPIILNLETNEFFDTYSGGEFWQENAKIKLIQMLISNCKDAQSYKKTRLGNNEKISTAHNAICISGSRGAGKTVFLRNAEAIWKDAEIQKIENINVSDLYFVETIDPTLLNIQDNFSNVIIAQLYNAVENKLSSPSVRTTKKNDFYTSLKELAESLGKKNDFSDNTGIDRILKYRSGIQIETFFHKYVENCLELLGCQAIVVPIDDVDMALNRAVEVLDEVRRLLSCPYIIPIVSGDHELYSHMVSVHFEKNATDKNNTSEETTKFGYKIGKSIAESYLTKVFPNHLRLPLLAIDRLLPHLRIKENGINENISFATYEKKITNVFFYLCNGEERSTEYPKPSSAREVTQLIKTLTPSKLQTSQSYDLWNTFKSWAEQKHHGATYTNAESISQLSDYNNPEDRAFRFDQLLAFNPILQAKESVAWANKCFLSEQITSIEDLITKGKNKEELLKANDNTNILRSVFTEDMKILRSMPVLEFYSSAMALKVDTVNTDNADLLLAIYTHRDYYGKQGNKTYNIFFSRAFEILSVSLLSTFENIKIVDWKVQLDEIIARVPFYSIHGINPTKYLEQEGERSLSDESAVLEHIEVTYKTSTLASQIKEWEITSNKKLGELKGFSILPLLHSVFNKVFTQLHILRTEITITKKHYSEHLTDTARRFEYIVINSFASFIQKNHVIQANTAIGAKVETLRDHNAFMGADRTLSRNIKGMVDDLLVNDESKTKSDVVTSGRNINSILLEVIWAHPIFVNLNQSQQSINEPKFQYTSNDPSTKSKPSLISKPSPKSNSSVKLNSLMSFKKVLVDKKIGMGIKAMTSWGFNNKKEASEIYSEAKKELEKDGENLELTPEHKKMFDVLGKVVNTSDFTDWVSDVSDDL